MVQDFKGKGAGDSTCMHTGGSTTVRKHRGHRWREQGTWVEGTVHILVSPWLCQASKSWGSTMQPWKVQGAVAHPQLCPHRALRWWSSCCWPGDSFLLACPSGIPAPAELTGSCDAERESQKQDGANQLMGCATLFRKETAPQSAGACRNPAVVEALAEIIRVLWTELFSPKK